MACIYTGIFNINANQTRFSRASAGLVRICYTNIEMTPLWPRARHHVYFISRSEPDSYARLAGNVVQIIMSKTFYFPSNMYTSVDTSDLEQ